MRLIVLSGLAGVGKTDLLEALHAAGEHVVDLEQLAGHRGSVFGGLDRPPQPSPDHFGAGLDATLRGAVPGRPTWIEDEGPFLGSLAIPPTLVQAMASADVVEVTAALPARIERLLRVYGALDRHLLATAARRLAPRLGHEPTLRIAESFEKGETAAAIAALLPYFDRGYEHRVRTLRRRSLDHVDLGDPGQVGQHVLRRTLALGGPTGRQGASGATASSAPPLGA